MNVKASDVNKLLCDNNTVEIHHVNQSDFLKKKTWLSKQDLQKNQLFLFPTKFTRILRRIKQVEHRQGPKKVQTQMSCCEKYENGEKTAAQQTFLQFPAPYWISNHAHTITRLGLTRRFFQTADLLTFHVLMHFSMRFLPSKWFFNTTIWKFCHQVTSRNSKQKISGRF